MNTMIRNKNGSAADRKSGAIMRKAASLAMSAMLVLIMTPMTVFALDPQPLTITSVVVTTGGDVGITFNRTLGDLTNITSKVQAGITINGIESTPKQIVGVSVHGENSNFIQLTLATKVHGGENATLSYNSSAGITADDGGVLASVASMDIVNNQAHPTLDVTGHPQGTVGTPYSFTLGITGGTSPYTCSLDSGSLPPGLTLSPLGVISGTPTTTGIYTAQIMVLDNVSALDIKSITIVVSGQNQNVCTLAGVDYPSLQDAVDTLTNGATGNITLMTDVTTSETLRIIGVSVIFNMNGHNININSQEAATAGLELRDAGHVQMFGNGELNVTGTSAGVMAFNGSTAQVTNATGTGFISIPADGPSYLNARKRGAGASGINGYGVYSATDSTVDVSGNATGIYYGVYATSAIARVRGNVTAIGKDSLGEGIGTGAGVYGLGASVIVGGNITSSKYGATASALGTVTVDGTITAPLYVKMGESAAMSADQFTEPTTKEGYRTYTKPSGTVWVKSGSIVPPAIFPPYLIPESYRIISGGNQTVTEGTESGITIVCSGTIEKFLTLKVDGKALGGSDYKAGRENTTAELMPAYIASLEPGKHLVEFTYSDGSASTYLIIAEKAADDDGEEPAEPDTTGETGTDEGEATPEHTGTTSPENTNTPDTGENNAMGLWLLLIAGAGTAAVVIRRKEYKD
jgi:hypothetical protein